MSHMVKVKSVMKNLSIQNAACKRLGLAAPRQGTQRFTDGNTAKGSVISLPGWNYPIVIEETGEVKFDNYNGAWGKIEELKKLKQAYATESVRLSVARTHRVTERLLPNGNIKLQLVAMA